MEFTFSEEQIAVKKAAKEFAEKELWPGIIERDESQSFPTEQIKKMGELGFLGMTVSQEYNGGGMDMIAYVLALEEIAKLDASSAVVMSVNNSLVCWGIEKYGSPQQKDQYLKDLAAGKKIGAFCLSEPGAGSDATAITTSAKDNGDHYIINGSKNWITNGSSAAVYLVFAQSNPSLKHKGINVFILDKSMPGIEVGRKENKLGIRASDTHSIHFNEVKVPKANRIGEDGFGFAFAMNTLNGGRIGIATQAVGIAAGALDLAAQYSRQRKAFGKELADLQGIQFKLAEVATRIEAARMLCLKAAFLKDRGEDYTLASAMAKYYASEVAFLASNEAIQIHGGYGYVKDYHVERYLRDAKITQIYEGTTEIQKIVISRELMKTYL